MAFPARTCQLYRVPARKIGVVYEAVKTLVQLRQRLDVVTQISYHSAWADGVHVRLSDNCETTADGDIGYVFEKEPGGGGVNLIEKALLDVPPLASVTVTVTG